MSSDTLCRYHMHGTCSRGEACPFSHSFAEAPSQVCTHFLKGTCAYGDRCRYLHRRPDWAPAREAAAPAGYRPPTEVAKPAPDALAAQLPISQLRLGGALARAPAAKRSPLAAALAAAAGDSSSSDSATAAAPLAPGRRSPPPVDLPADPFDGAAGGDGDGGATEHDAAAAALASSAAALLDIPRRAPPEGAAAAAGSWHDESGGVYAVPVDVGPRNRAIRSAAGSLDGRGSYGGGGAGSYGGADEAGAYFAGGEFDAAGGEYGAAGGEEAAEAAGYYGSYGSYGGEPAAWHVPGYAGAHASAGGSPDDGGDWASPALDARRFYAAPALRSMCFEWYNTGACARGSACALAHGAPCPGCARWAIHPTDAAAAAAHAAECGARHARLAARARSSHVECGICLERVLDRGQKFGLLACEHAFCLGCIRGWRAAVAGGADLESALRTCPVCRAATHFITPSAVWPATAEEKEAVCAGYRAKLASIDCRHFAAGEGACPFGTSCMYRHAYADGRLEERALRRVAGEEGEVRVVQPVRLADFIVVRQGRVGRRGRR
jgi:E3 ubiquitin-protein ligase makorin